MDIKVLLDIFLRLGVAALIGGAVGVERALHGRWAGLRTHMLVSVGAAIFTIAAVHIADGSYAEVSRVVQGVAAGVGFLGAGTILKLSSDMEVKGLTTAASIWLAAALGTSAGLKMMELAVAGTLVAILILALLRPAAKRFERTGDGEKE